jgi:hypothetical protein
MAYTVISDFKYGLDRRRPQSSGVPGTLWVAKNCVVTRGGDIERVKDFVKVFDLPAGKTTGFFSVKGQRYVFGHEATPTGMPAGVIYQRLQAPSGAALTRVLDAKGYDGRCTPSHSSRTATSTTTTMARASRIGIIWRRTPSRTSR